MADAQRRLCRQCPPIHGVLTASGSLHKYHLRWAGKGLNLLAASVVEAATAEQPQPAQEAKPEAIPEGKNPHAVALGRLGGKKGGPARAKRLPPEERKEIARKAALVRWTQKK